jgi:hypothetical protein
MGAVRVSICIPTRDRCGYLHSALCGALAQDIDGLEVLVHDDASGDETAELVAGLSDPRVRYRRHAQPVGIAANRNSCLAAARGRYLAWLDDDDERLPGTLAGQLELLDTHPEVGVVHAGHEVIDAGGARLPDWPAPFRADTVESSADAFRNLIAANELTTSTVVVRRSLQLAAGGFAPEIGASSTDWEGWCRLALRGAVAYLVSPVARYRRHPASVSSRTTAAGERLLCNIRVIESVLHRDRALLTDPHQAWRLAGAGLAAQALFQAGDAHTRGARAGALEAVAVAERFIPGDGLTELRRAYEAGEDEASLRATRAALGRLAIVLQGTRCGARVARGAAGDPGWEAQLQRAGRTAGRLTPPDAVIAAIAKWDPTVLRCAGRDGCNYPDRRLLDGYPADGPAAVAHLDALQERRGVTHLVVPGASDWWLNEYPELAARVGIPLHTDADCSIYALTSG